MNHEMAYFAQQLRKLVDDYYHQQITLDDYRSQRQRLLDQIDLEINENIPSRDAT